ncbi:Uncharacterized protein FWK35_00026580 [Aphis craccivora]|uniref:Uncharacterized protein n=1 Tax=Aphis craccivora TaxID=307492 RepID=A0A6G0Y949_APHCR|nr:Uncharacterized protein FWK35_00026580 [Aphis craccivora]
MNPPIFKSAEKNRKKNEGKTGIFTQNQFSTKSIFLYVCNSKTNHCKCLKFSPNVYVNVIYIQLNFQNILTFFDVDKKILDDQKYKSLILENFTIPHKHNFFLSEFEVQLRFTIIIKELKFWCIQAIKT